MRSILPNIPAELMIALTKGEVIPFVGGGVSMSVTDRSGKPAFPSWSQLLRNGSLMLQNDGKRNKSEFIKACAENETEDFLRAAEVLQKELGPKAWHEFLRGQLDPNRSLINPESLGVARAIWDLGSKLVITTNYDRVLKWSCPDASTDLPLEISTSSDILRTALLRGLPELRTIWYLHGNMDRSSDIVLTGSEYDQHYKPRGRTRATGQSIEVLKLLMASKTFLFAGFSFADAYVSGTLRSVYRQFGGLTGEHFVLALGKDAVALQKDFPALRVIPFDDFGTPLLSLLHDMGKIARRVKAQRRKVERNDSANAPASQQFLATNGGIARYKRGLAKKESTVTILGRNLDVGSHYFRQGARNLDAEEDVNDVVAMLAAEEPRRVCILGPSGAGKTSALRRLLGECVDRPIVPFFIQLRSYASPAKRGEVDIEAWLMKSVESFKLGVSTRGILRTLIRDRRGVFVFDGFDELRFDSTWASQIADGIESYFAASDEAKVIVTSRTVEDFHGRLSGYQPFRLVPVSAAEIKEFAEALGIDLPAHSPLLSDTSQRSHFELWPVLLLVALVARTRGGAKGLEDISTRFALLEYTLGLTLGEADRPIHRALDHISTTGLRDIRFDLLDMVVRGWEVSAKPADIESSTMLEYVKRAIVGSKEMSGRRASIGNEKLELVVPIGICLQQFGDTHSYGFSHSSFQDFAYARALLRVIRGKRKRKAQDMMTRDYYSAEILQLLAEAVADPEVATLEQWAADSKELPMVRKLSIGALGFLPPAKRRPGLLELLRSVLVQEADDIGVGGRAAEALRKLGVSNAVDDFIAKLSSYSSRPPRAEHVGNPLTFEINVPLPLAARFREALEEHLGHKDPATRKHALIMLMRAGQIRVDLIVRYCRRELLDAEQVALHSRQPRIVVAEYLRSLRYGLEALLRFGSGIEAPFVRAFAKRAISHRWMHPAVRADLRMALEQLTASSSALDKIGLRRAEDIHLYLVRHGESDGNSAGRLLGARLGGSLTDIGRTQAAALGREFANRLAGFRVVVASSPSARARSTADAIGSSLLCGPIIEEPMLSEMDFGEWSGKLIKDVRDGNDGLYDKWQSDPHEYSAPGGESMFEVKSRAVLGLARLLEPLINDETSWATGSPVSDSIGLSRAIVLVTHAYPLEALVEVLVGRPLESRPSNGSITELTLKNGEWHSVAAAGSSRFSA